MPVNLSSLTYQNEEKGVNGLFEKPAKSTEDRIPYSVPTPEPARQDLEAGCSTKFPGSANFPAISRHSFQTPTSCFI
jgi:hypothetical protein